MFQIETMLYTVESFSMLQDCRIEGIDSIVTKFQHIYSTIHKKPYDILDHRKQDFDHDFTDFLRQIEDVQV